MGTLPTKKRAAASMGLAVPMMEGGIGAMSVQAMSSVRRRTEPSGSRWP